MQADKHCKREHYRSIAEIGSLDFQRKWCVQGTPNEYLLLDELLEIAMHRIKHNATHPLLSRNLTEAEKAALLELHSKLDELFDTVPWNDPNVSIEQIVEQNEAMKQIRQAANNCLHELGVSFTMEELLHI